MSASTQYRKIEVRPLSDAVGAEIHGVDLRSDLGSETYAEIRHAFHAHGVIFFRDQQLTPEQHIAFAQKWGPINVNRFFQSVEGYPQIAQVLKEPHHNKNVGSGWHTDHTYDIEPALGSALYAKELPKAGGNTLFASMGAAFEALSEGLKDTLRGLNARHSSRHVFGKARHETPEQAKDWEGRIHNPEAALQDAVHPVVIKHPETRRETLYVNAGFTLGFEGWSDAESAPLLSYLYEHAVQEQFTCDFNWSLGSLALWDNRATWHCAPNDYPGERRYMHRVTIAGSALGH
jgi:taurine dioxygenase